MRSSNTCDGCALRRVRCDANRPCSECQKRSIPCTALRVKRKRGPKGPRQTTTNKIRTFQRQLQEGGKGQSKEEGENYGSPEKNDATPFSVYSHISPSIGDSPSEFPSPQPSQKPTLGPAPVYRRQPVAAYCRFLDVFQTRVYSVWPIVSCDALARRLVENEDQVKAAHNENNYDYEAWTLAAAACAAVIAQLRLPEHDRHRSPSRDNSLPAVSSHSFAADAEHFRTRYDAREHISVSSLLASFFLHIYYANDGRLRTAGLCLRESLTQAHMLGLHRSDTYQSTAMSEDDRELRLRVYWVLFVSERTYCVQNGLPPILRPIRERPAAYDRSNSGSNNSNSSPIGSFLDLTRLFTFLDGDLIEPPSAISHSHILPPPDDDRENEEEEDELEKDKKDRQKQTRRRVTLFQSDLDSCADEHQQLVHRTSVGGLDETQRVDLFVTRNWIRILLWEYSVRHFVMSSSPPSHQNDQAFSMLLPALVAHSMLGFLSSISSPESIRAHGYGMELKVFRIADCLLDVLAACGSSSNNMMVGSPRDTLHGLERVLATVGGSQSVFLGRLHSRMAEVQLPVVAAAPSPAWPPMITAPETETGTETTDTCVNNYDDVHNMLAMDMDLSVLDDDSFLVGF